MPLSQLAYRKNIRSLYHKKFNANLTTLYGVVAWAHKYGRKRFEDLFRLNTEQIENLTVLQCHFDDKNFVNRIDLYDHHGEVFTIWGPRANAITSSLRLMNPKRKRGDSRIP